MSPTNARPFLGAVLVIGIALIVMPFAIGLPSKASHGQTMIDQFRPIMQQSSVNTAANYYNKTFAPLRAVATGGAKAAGEIQPMMSGLAQELHMTPAQLQQFLGKQYPAMAKLLGSFPQLVPVFDKVPAGLDAYKPLLTTMQANVENYASISSLPNFRLFTWFFVVPGVLLVVLSGWPLLAARRHRATAATPVQAS